MTYTPLEEMTVTLAGRYNEVKELYGNTLLRKPLTPRWRGMLSVSYSPFMEIWQFDVTLAMNGGGRMPKSYLLNGAQAWASTFKAYAQLNAQVTRNFRHWSIYVGGDNITNYKQKTPIIDAANPWGNNFDATMVYAPLHGIVVYAGFRYKFTAY
jgi:outer membrane receptor protein involved in Fe transport